MSSPLDPRPLGKAIAEERRSKGLKQKEVVERISSYYSDERSYRRVELGERLPGRDVVIAILRSGLSVNEVEKVNRILALGGYAPLTAAEAKQHGTGVLQQAISPAAPVPRSTGFWNRLGQKSELRFATFIAACSLGFGFAIAAVSQETVLMMVSAILYGSLYAVSILLESEFDPVPAPKWPVTAAAFGLTMFTSVLALAIDAWLVRIGISAALPLALTIFLFAAAAQWAIARSALSESAVVPTRFQAHTAQAAHLKNTAYFLLIVVLFWLPPFHCVAVLRREVQNGHAAWVKSILAHHLLLGSDFVCFSVEWLWIGFLFLVLLSLPMAVRLLENLKSDTRLNAFTALFYLRGVLYFLLIFVCLIWYSAAIASLSV